MLEAGVSLLAETNLLGAVGLSEALRTVPGVMRVFGRIRARLNARLPQGAVLIGHDVFHLALARWLRARGVKTFSVFPPQVWLWGSLARPIARCYDWILTSFPEEEEVYRLAGGKTFYIGHYLKDVLMPATAQQKEQARDQLDLAPDSRVVGLFPGSRIQEVRTHTSVCLQTARLMLSRDPSLRFVLPLADPGLRRLVEDHLREKALSKRVGLCHDSRQALRACDLALACSGTVTLESLLMEVPMVIFYRVALPTLATTRLLSAVGLIKTQTIGLPNLLARSRIVPEVYQNVDPARLAEDAFSILEDSSRRRKVKSRLRELRAALGPGDSMTRAASIILSLLEPEMRKAGPAATRQAAEHVQSGPAPRGRRTCIR